MGNEELARTGSQKVIRRWVVVRRPRYLVQDWRYGWMRRKVGR